MAYLKPNWFERNIFKHLAMKSGLMGTNTLLVPGRSSGRPQRVPVIPVEHGGARYLVSTRGESNWVRNLRAAGRAVLKRGSKTQPLARGYSRRASRAGRRESADRSKDRGRARAAATNHPEAR